MTVRVLILDDNPTARAFLARVVRSSFEGEITVAQAGDLESARRVLAAGPPPDADGQLAGFDLLLVDLELPDGSGIDWLAELVDHPARKIVTTLYSDDEHLFPALTRGADGYLLKEDRFELLVEELQKILRGEPPLSPAIARRLLEHFRGAPPPRPAAPPADVLAEGERLTPRETEVLTFLSKGFTIKEIAGLMGIKWFTVNDHIKSIYKKLNVGSRAEAAVLASKHGLV